MMTPTEIKQKIRENLQVLISPETGIINCTSWVMPLDNGITYESTLSDVPFESVTETELIIRELYKITIEQLMEDARNGVI